MSSQEDFVTQYVVQQGSNKRWLSVVVNFRNYNLPQKGFYAITYFNQYTVVIYISAGIIVGIS